MPPPGQKVGKRHHSQQMPKLVYAGLFRPRSSVFLLLDDIYIVLVGVLSYVEQSNKGS